MASNEHPPCLSCGHAMDITTTNDPGRGLQGFERQDLTCPNCGDRDSRFAFVLAEADSVSLAADERSVLFSDTELSFPEQHLDSDQSAESPQTSLEVLLANGGPLVADHSNRVAEVLPVIDDGVQEAPSSLWTHGSDRQAVRTPAETELQSTELQGEKNAAEHHRQLPELIQTYLAKWRQTPNV